MDCAAQHYTPACRAHTHAPHRARSRACHCLHNTAALPYAQRRYCARLPAHRCCRATRARAAQHTPARAPCCRTPAPAPRTRALHRCALPFTLPMWRNSIAFALPTACAHFAARCWSYAMFRLLRAERLDYGSLTIHSRVTCETSARNMALVTTILHSSPGSRSMWTPSHSRVTVPVSL